MPPDLIMTPTKRCRKCGVDKPLADFYGDRSRADGRRNSCIECDKKRKRTPEVREQNHRYYHSAKGKAAERRYRESEKYKVTSAAYVRPPESVERQRAYARAWHQRPENQERAKESLRTRKANAEWRHRRTIYERDIRRRKSDCWKKPYGGIESQNPEVAFEIKLKRDGTLESAPVPEGIPATPYLRVYQESALRAIIECQPYNLPAAFFDEWKYFAPVFTERKT